MSAVAARTGSSRTPTAKNSKHRPDVRSIIKRSRPILLAPYVVAVSGLWMVYSWLGYRIAGASSMWDAQHYLAVAAHGYPNRVDVAYSNIAFFPGMPLAVRFVHISGLSYIWSGFVVSVIAGGVFCYCGSLLVSRRYGLEAGRRASFLLAVTPGSFLFGTSYADPLAIAFVAACLLALDCRKFVLGGILGGFATACSPLAIPVCVAGLVVAVKQRGWALAVPLLMPLGAAAYMAYVWIHTGDITAWFTVQHKSWFAGLNWKGPWERVTDSTAPTLIPLTVMASCALAVAGMWQMAKARVPLEWWALTICVLSLGMFDNGGWLNPRYLINAFPLTLAAAARVKGRTFVALVIGCAVLAELLLYSYTVWANVIAQP